MDEILCNFPRTSFLSSIKHTPVSLQQDRKHLCGHKNALSDDSEPTCHRAALQNAITPNMLIAGAAVPFCCLARSFEAENLRLETRRCPEVLRLRWNKIVKRVLSCSKTRCGGFYGEKPGEREEERERSVGADRVAGPVRCPGPCCVGTDLWPTDLRDKFYCKRSWMRIPSA